jgi:hypothetical protein
MEATVSTIVLLAVTITVAVGVAYWMGGINAIYAQYEQLEIHTITCNIVRGITRSYWEIEIKCKNSGPRTITVDALFLNNIPANSRELIPPVGGISSNLPINGQTILSGETKSIFIFIDGTFGNLSSGTTIQVRLHSSTGMEYTKQIELV